MTAWADRAREAWAAEQRAELERAKRTGTHAHVALLERLASFGVVDTWQEVPDAQLQVEPGGAWRYELTDRLAALQHERERWVELDGRRIGALDTLADLGRALELEERAGEVAPAEADAPASTGELLLQVLRALVRDVISEELEGGRP